MFDIENFTINTLQNVNFIFTIEKVPEVIYHLQNVSLPGLSLSSAEIATPYSRFHEPGEVTEFEDLSISFLVDAEMKNYAAISNWIMGLGFPENASQYTDFLNQNNGEKSDAQLMILDPHNKPVKTVQFLNMFPINISPIDFNPTEQEPQPVQATVTFKVDRYKFI